MDMFFKFQSINVKTIGIEYFHRPKKWYKTMRRDKRG